MVFCSHAVFSYVHIVSVNVGVVSRGACVLHRHIGGTHLHHNVVATVQQCVVCNVYLRVEGVGLMRKVGGACPQTDWLAVV